jgi:hypothetical protein
MQQECNAFDMADAAMTRFFAWACSVALTSFYAGLLRMPDCRILEYWSFTVYKCFQMWYCRMIIISLTRYYPNTHPEGQRKSMGNFGQSSCSLSGIETRAVMSMSQSHYCWAKLLIGGFSSRLYMVCWEWWPNLMLEHSNLCTVVGFVDMSSQVINICSATDC